MFAIVVIQLIAIGLIYSKLLDIESKLHKQNDELDLKLATLEDMINSVDSTCDRIEDDINMLSEISTRKEIEYEQRYMS